MDLLISMKAETILRSLEYGPGMMRTPTAQAKPYFIAEFREDKEDKLKLLKDYADILKKKLDGNEEFLIEYTNIGIIVKKRVDEKVEYMEEWEGWVSFSRNLYDELLHFVGE
jgi:hypothetical protein